MNPRCFQSRVQIEARIEESKKLKDRVKILKDFQVSTRKRVGLVLSQKKDHRVQLISAPKRGEKKASAMKFGPEDNRDVAFYKDAITKFPLALQRQRWSNEERDNLRKGIKQEFQKALLEKSVDLISYSEGSYGISSDIDNVMASIKGLEITPENIRAYLPKVNWDNFASIYHQGRSGAECEARWLNWEDPLRNNTRWTRTEDKELLLIVKEKEMSNWIDIAVSLGTNRTPFQCLARFQRSLNAQMVKREWEEEEDARLCAAVRVFGESNWQMVASVLDKRTGTQCSNRWKKSLNPARVRVGRWTIDEDKRMKVSVKLFGAKCWSKIAQFVPGRTQVQCRERWVNCLDPSLNWDPWTEDEDLKLMTAITEYNYCWSKVAACIPPRTDNQCRRRWMVLCPDDVYRLQAAKKIQQVALISNFVDRETERPDLGPEDFVPPLILCPAFEPYSEEPTNKRKRKRREKRASPMNNAEYNMGCSDSQKKKRCPRRRKEAQVDNEATLGAVDVNEATEAVICLNEYVGTVENSTIVHPGSFECNEQGKADSSLYLELEPTDTGDEGKCGRSNYLKRKKYKPRRKARAENVPVQSKAFLPAAQSESMLMNHSFSHEIPVENNTTSTQKRRTTIKQNKKKSCSIYKKNDYEFAAGTLSLQMQTPDKSASIPGAIVATSKSCKRERVTASSSLKDAVSFHRPSSCSCCLESIVCHQGAVNGTRVNGELIAGKAAACLEENDFIPLASLGKRDKNFSQNEAEYAQEANSRSEMNNKFCCEQPATSLGEDDSLALTSFIKRKRNVCNARIENGHNVDKGRKMEIISVEQVGAGLNEDDIPLALFIKKVKRVKEKI
uniref:Uncharacterized protein n=1 Tax=Kalanchoe fedtschenkoi TaxID=63787 RepID=A0A7N0V7C5_KALFE